ncbi:heavy-metal-associated domain-containing protein [Croceicoccus ponticola]|uniref:Heavy-metal-associated domain-containing protein n=1 Tax=Croceicoccus ponticola TaxID=2217664 RepID=A0A437GXT8_9SPHN|nr:heavy-metal-associated domain-containing protein [Croceicoccus ponticola]
MVLVTALLALAVLAGWRLIAQVEGDRGIAPFANTGDFEVGGIKVNTTGKNAIEARENGWKEAQRKAWEVLYERTHAGEKAPVLPESQLQSMISAVVIEREEIGPRRYIATLGVIFDRARTGEIFGTTNSLTRSAPQLVVPIVYQGGVGQLYEMRTPWQRAWAEYRNANSPIDYVRPYGGGGESLLLTAGQMGRRSRSWWRVILDEFGAANVVFPVARLERQWPGGPVKGTFTARYGADNTYLASFTMTAKTEEALPAMLAQAVNKLDSIYAQALASGKLSADKTLDIEEGVIDPELLAALTAAANDGAAPAPVARETSAATPAPAQTATPAGISIAVQIATPDPASFDAALRALNSVPGVTGTTTSSLAIGGTSVMQVGYSGDIAALAGSLRARGWQVTQGTDALRISR